jgi:hypothetical protein
MKLKLDLHTIYSDTRKIEQSLVDIIAEAVAKRATEIEIIPGKGSGALKKSVLRFLERPEIKSQYHRVEKDDENFGRIFVHFRFTSEKQTPAKPAPKFVKQGKCFCCQEDVSMFLDEELKASDRVQHTIECPSCGSPNRITVTGGRGGRFGISVEPGYEAAL